MKNDAARDSRQSQLDARTRSRARFDAEGPKAGRQRSAPQSEPGPQESPAKARRRVSRWSCGYRSPTLSVHADPHFGLPSHLLNRVRPQIEKIALPRGYSLEWGGEDEDSGEARAALANHIPAVLLAVLSVVWLFNSIRATLVIYLAVPLAIIGVTVGLLLTRQPFGFMALLGVISLGGEQIKNPSRWWTRSTPSPKKRRLMGLGRCERQPPAARATSRYGDRLRSICRRDECLEDRLGIAYGHQTRNHMYCVGSGPMPI
jgi:hypothetical protein